MIAAVCFVWYVFIQVVPMVLQNLPLKEDFDEYNTVYTCLAHLYTNYQKLVSYCIIVRAFYFIS